MERAIYDRMRTLEASHWWFTGRRDILTRVIADLPLPPKARILEVGCGVGGNIEMLRRFGEVQALEPDADSRAYIEQRLGLTPADGLLPHALPYAPGRFDLVCALDVVEHVEDDAGALAALRRLVAPGGFLVVTVPAYGWMWSRHDEAHHHKRRYTLAKVERLGRAAGLTPVKQSYFNAVLFPLAAAIRIAKRVLRIDSEDDAMPPRAVNGLLRKVFGAEAGWLARGSLPFGLSILFVARPGHEAA